MSDISHQKELLLLNRLKMASGGDARALKDAFTQLKDRIGPRDGQIAGTIGALLHHTEPDIRIVAALALGKIGPKAAARFIPALTDILCKDPELAVSCAAAGGLGLLKCPQSLDALISAATTLRNSDNLERIAIHLFGAIGRFEVDGEKALPLLRTITDTIKDRDSSVRYHAQEALNKVQSDVRYRNAELIQKYCEGEVGPDGLVVPPHAITNSCDSVLAGLREGEFGLETNQLFAFIVSGHMTLCRVQIYKRNDGGKIVAMIADDHSTGTIQTASEHIASAIRRQFSLDPDNTYWIEHWDKTYYGDEPKTLVVKYKRNSKGYFMDPSWTSAKSFSEALQKLDVNLGTKNG